MRILIMQPTKFSNVTKESIMFDMYFTCNLYSEKSQLDIDYLKNRM